MPMPMLSAASAVVRAVPTCGANQPTSGTPIKVPTIAHTCAIPVPKSLPPMDLKCIEMRTVAPYPAAVSNVPTSTNKALNRRMAEVLDHG